MSQKFSYVIVIIVFLVFTSCLNKNSAKNLQTASLNRQGKDLAIRGDDSFDLIVEFKKPIKENALIFQEKIGLKLFCSQRYSFINISAKELKDKMGLNLKTICTPNSGNSIGLPGYQTEIIDKGELREEYKPLLKLFSIQNDPKFEIYDNSSTENCEKYFSSFTN